MESFVLREEKERARVKDEIAKFDGVLLESVKYDEEFWSEKDLRHRKSYKYELTVSTKGSSMPKELLTNSFGKNPDADGGYRIEEAFVQGGKLKARFARTGRDRY